MAETKTTSTKPVGAASTASLPADQQPKGEPAAVTPATEFSPSGAPRQLTEIDVAHPAVDNDPRAGTTKVQNQADFNDPTLDGATAVARSLNEQGVPTKTADEAEKAPAKP